MPNTWFFMSYARLDLNPYLVKFYRDLAETIRGLVGGEPEQIGFLDIEGIEPGQAWPQRLAEALQATRVFVPIYSPTYFSRESCGKEWQVFRSRLDVYALAQGKPHPPLILPVLWVPAKYLPKPLPDVAAHLQYTHDDFDPGGLYSSKGLRQLAALNQYRDAYKAFVFEFAEKLVSHANSHPLPPAENVMQITEVQSAFDPGVSLPLAAGQPSHNVGPRYVQFIFVAGRQAELEALREKVEFYGEEGGLDWRPYLPNVPEEIAIIAQKIACQERLRYEVVPLDAHLIQHLQNANRENKLVVIVVDSWTLLLQDYQNIIKQYDNCDFLNCILLILWNTEDDETEVNRFRLENNVLYTFPTKVIKKDPSSFLDRIGTVDELQQELCAILSKARMRIVNLAREIKKIETERIIAKPTISAAGGQ